MSFMQAFVVWVLSSSLMQYFHTIEFEPKVNDVSTRRNEHLAAQLIADLALVGPCTGRIWHRKRLANFEGEFRFKAVRKAAKAKKRRPMFLDGFLTPVDGFLVSICPAGCTVGETAGVTVGSRSLGPSRSDLTNNNCATWHGYFALLLSAKIREFFM